MQTLILILAIAVLVIVLILYLSNFAFRLALSRGDEKLQQRLPGKLQDYPNNGWIDENTEKIILESDDGLKLAGFLHDAGTGRFAVLCHGYRGDRYMLDLPAAMFSEMGFGVLLPDARGHGASEGKYIGMGWPERRDLIRWCRLLNEQYGEDIEIVLYGVSMGAATVMLAGGEEDLPDNVRCIVEDCGFSDFWEQGAHLMKMFYSLPPFPVMYMINSVCKRKAGYSVKEVRPVDAVKKCRVPILFIHGAKDNFVPFSMLSVLYDAADCPKEKQVFDQAAHAQSFKTEPERYFTVINEFIR